MKNETNTTANEYHQQAWDFLSRNGLKFRATLSDSKTPAWAKEGEETGHHYRVTLSRGKSPRPVCSGTTLHPDRLVFDFWGSVADAQAPTKAKSALWKAEQQERDILNTAQEDANRVTSGEWKRKRAAKHEADLVLVRAEIQRLKVACEPKHPSAYDVLACISSDAHTPETFADFCAEYGYEADSIKALQQFHRCDRFAKRLRAFFTSAELEELSEIQ